MTTIEVIKGALKEDIKHVLEELWDAEEEQPLFKSSRETTWELKSFIQF